MQQLMEHPGVSRVRGDMCRHDMRISGPHGDEGLARKPTGWLSNSPIILEELNVQCTNDHKHASLENGRANQAAMYPEKLCYAVLRGVRRQMVALVVAHTGEIGAICEDLDEHMFPGNQ